MAVFDYQFATVDQLLVARDATAAVANDWLGRILTSVAAANGAGFVTILTNVATKGFPRWLVGALAIAAVCFFVGLGFASATLYQLQARYEIKANSLHQDMQNEWLRQRAKIGTAEDKEHIKQFLELGASNAGASWTAIASIEQSMGQLIRYAFFAFMAGLLLTFFATTGWAWASAKSKIAAPQAAKPRSNGMWRRRPC